MGHPSGATQRVPLLLRSRSARSCRCCKTQSTCLTAKRRPISPNRCSKTPNHEMRRHSIQENGSYLCPLRVHFSSPLTGSQILTVLSLELLASKVPSWLKATEVTPYECPLTGHSGLCLYSQGRPPPCEHVHSGLSFECPLRGHRYVPFLCIECLLS